MNWQLKSRLEQITKDNPQINKILKVTNRRCHLYFCEYEVLIKCASNVKATTTIREYHTPEAEIEWMRIKTKVGAK